MIQPIHTVVHDRKVVVPVPDDLPDGTMVEVTITPEPEKIGIDELELDNSPAGIEAWCQWLHSIEPVEFRQPDAFDEQFRKVNVEAVREQMFGDE